MKIVKAITWILLVLIGGYLTYHCAVAYIAHGDMFYFCVVTAYMAVLFLGFFRLLRGILKKRDRKIKQEA